MIYYLALILTLWSMVFTSGRFIKYYRIVRDYDRKTEATVLQISLHQSNNRKKYKVYDVRLGYIIDGKEGETEILVDQDQAEEFALGRKVPVCYRVSGNGAVHIASDHPAAKKLLVGHGATIGIELVVFIVIWLQII